MTKPRLAIFDFACCEGCQLQIVNLEEEILDLLNVVEPVEWREALSDHSDQYDIAVVEGSITRPADEERLKEIRRRAKTLIALGACATLGGVNKLKNNFEMGWVKRAVYGEAADMPHLDTAPTKSLDEVVVVDYKIHGCPVDREELKAILCAIAMGRTPHIPNHPVCVECKLKENDCRFHANEICLGPLTRAGCGARCPSKGFWCFGCRGFVDEPNLEAARNVMKDYGKTLDDLRDRLLLFNSQKGGLHGQNH